jgi:peptide/nickel transport system substrate-binding protein
MKRTSFLILVSMSFLASIFFPTEGYSAAVDKPRKGGTLRIGLRKDITNLNPFIEYLSTNALVRSLVYEGLTEVNKNLEVVPSLAESWAISKDGKEYTVRLRKGVFFHSGKELDAEDVKWSLEYALDPKNRAYVQGSVSVIGKVEVTEKHSLKLTLKQPFEPLLAIGLSGDTVMVPKNSVPAGETLSVSPPGTGPFQFVEWKRSSEIRQVVNKRYWNKGVPYLNELIFKPVPSSDVRFISLRSGDLDLIEEIPYPMVNEVMKGKHPDIKLAPATIAGFRMIKMNVEAPYFKDPRIRRAVAYAVDRKAYIEGATFGHGDPAYQVYPKGWKWYFDDVKNLELDREKARALLAEAGYPNGFKSFLQVRQGEEAENMMLQDQLKRIGIDLEIKSMDFAQHRKSTRDGTYDIQISGSDVYADIDRAVHTNFHSETGPGRVRNHTGYKNPEVDRLLDQARALTDFKERRELYKKMTEILNNDSPQVNVAFITRYYGYRPHVKGFTTNPNGDLSFAEGGIPVTWVERDGK